VFLIWATMIAVVAWGLTRLARALGEAPEMRPPGRATALAPRAGQQPTTA
jgi:hypothetical protein